MGTVSLVREHFVGRADELAAMLEAFDLAARGQRTVVLLTGDLGIGKSRLAQKLIALIADRSAAVARGHCLENLQTPFLPLFEILRDLGQESTSSEPVPEGRSAVGTRSRDAQARRFREISQALQQPVGNRPYVVIIEDLQWVDAATLGFLEYLSLTQPEGPLFVILTVRSDALERSQGFARVLARMRASGLITIPLRPLARGDVSELIRLASPKSIERASAERIKDLAEGNPLFAEELLRAVLDDGTSTIPRTALSSVRSTVLERFYQLSEADQRVLCCASVVGRVFDVRLVAALVDRPLVDVLASLRHARNLQLIREHVNATPHDIAFWHPVYCDIIYRELLAVEAQVLHARVAEAITESSDAGRRFGELAYHWSTAGNVENSLLYNTLAGDAAAALAAYEDAAGFYEAALARMQKGTAIYAELAEKRAYAWYAAGVLERTPEPFAEALTAYASIGSNHKVAEMTLFLSRQAWNDAETPSGYEYALRALEIIGESDTTLRDLALTMAATHAVHLGWPQEAEDLLDRARPAATSDVVARRLDTMGIAKCRRRHPGASLETMLLAREAADMSADTDVIVRIYSNSADIAAVYGDIAAQHKFWEFALVAAQKGRYIGRTAYAALGYASALIDAGDLRKARELYTIAIETGVTNASVALLEACVGSLLRALTGERRPPLRSENDALDLAIRTRESARIGQVGFSLAFAAIADDRLDEARNFIDQAVSALEVGDFAELLLLIGGLYGSIDVRKRARNFLEDSAATKEHRLARTAFDTLLAHERSGPTRSGVLRMVADQWSSLQRPLMQSLVLLDAGASAAARDVLNAINATALTSRLGNPSRDTRPPTGLTKRELQVACLIAEGCSNRTIGNKLGISERTVEHHVASILSRMGIRSRWLLTPQLLEPFTP